MRFPSPGSPSRPSRLPPSTSSVSYNHPPNHPILSLSHFVPHLLVSYRHLLVQWNLQCSLFCSRPPKCVAAATSGRPPHVRCSTRGTLHERRGACSAASTCGCRLGPPQARARPDMNLLKARWLLKNGWRAFTDLVIASPWRHISPFMLPRRSPEVLWGLQTDKHEAEEQARHGVPTAGQPCGS